MANYYKASGKISLSSILYFGLTSLIILPLLSLIYTYLIWYIPIIYLNILITIGFGFAVSISINFLVIKYGKVRSPTIALIFGSLGAILASYYSWAIWVDLVINSGEFYGTSRIGITASNIKINQVLDLILHPNELMSIVTEINQIGTWGIRSATVTGVFLTIIWSIEFLIVFVLTLISSFSGAKIPFCESEEKWFEELTFPGFSFIEDTNKLLSDLEAQSSKSFETLEIIKNQETESHSSFTLYYSKKGESYLTVENKLATINKKEEVDFDDTTIVEYIAINNLMKEKLEEINK